MIVDDNPRMRSMVRSMIPPGMNDIVEYGDAAEAVRQFPASVPDLVLMDIVMKDLDGIAATKIITERSPSSRVIIVSQYGDDDLRRAAFEAGAAGYVSKEQLSMLGGMINSMRGSAASDP